MTERRAARRYDLALPVLLRVPSGENGTAQEGKTRNVSTRGVYMILEQMISRDVDVDLNLVLPTDTSGQSNVYVRAVGRIIRVEEFVKDRTRRVGVAAVIRRYEIVRREEPGFLRRTL